ncbi:MAG: glycoside hydrolase family 32 protein, partial [Gemmataceae bacterium]
VDWNNSSGFGKDGKAPLVLIYTAAGNPTTQCLAYSHDGRNFVKYSGNPVVKQITDGNRDPKVFWHEPTKRWVMTLYVELNKIHTIHFFTSTNLKDWTLESKVDGFFECPDFFELPVDGDPNNKKWVLTAASSEYMIGRFDGKTFTPETKKILGHRGKGFYAPQTFSDIPSRDGRRIQIGWFQTPTRGMTFNQSMSIPLDLQLINTAEGPRMTMQPVKELEQLRKKVHKVAATELTPTSPNPLAQIQAELVELRAEIDPGTATHIELTLRGEKVFYEVKRQDFLVNDYRTYAPLREGKLKLTVYLDRTGMELFASDGLSYVPMPMQPKSENRGLSLHVKGGNAKLISTQVYELGSAWKGIK